MYELIRAGERSYYIDCPAKIGLFEVEGGVCLVDSGNDKDAGRKVRQILDQERLEAARHPGDALQRRPHRRLPVPAKADRLPGVRPGH